MVWQWDSDHPDIPSLLWDLVSFHICWWTGRSVDTKIEMCGMGTFTNKRQYHGHRIVLSHAMLLWFLIIFAYTTPAFPHPYIVMFLSTRKQNMSSICCVFDNTAAALIWCVYLDFILFWRKRICAMRICHFLSCDTEICSMNCVLTTLKVDLAFAFRGGKKRRRRTRGFLYILLSSHGTISAAFYKWPFLN